MHDTKIAGYDFPNIWRLPLRHHAPRVGKLLKVLDSRDETTDGQVGPGRGIGINEGANLLEISD